MKKFILLTFILLSLLGTTSFAYTEKSITGSHGETYITVNPDSYNVESIEYDSVKVTCVITGKYYIFTLCKDAYCLEKAYLFDKSILDKFNKAIILDFAKSFAVS